MTIYLVTLLLIGGAVALWYIIDTMWLQPPDRHRAVVVPGQYNEHKQKIAISAIAQLWNKQNDLRLTISELSLLWRSTQEQNNAPHGKGADYFTSESLIAFYDQFVNTQLFLMRDREVVVEIMRMLDGDDGNAPSVVMGANEIEASLEQSVYTKLASVSLREHSIHVAKKIVALLTAASAPALIPKGIIAALAHDLGKIPRFHETLYATGDHPIISIAILTQMAHWSSLPYAQEIQEAIKSHHRTPKTILATKLKEADQAVRRDELELLSSAQESHTNTEGVSGLYKAIVGHHEASPAPSPAPPAQVVALVSAHLDSPDPGHTVDAEGLRQHILQAINVVNAGKWQVWSMRDGRIYVRPDHIVAYLEGVGGPINSENRTQYLIEAVNVLHGQYECIDRSLVRSGFYAAQMRVIYQNGATTEMLLTVLLADPLGLKAADLEKDKPARIRQIKDVVPA